VGYRHWVYMQPLTFTALIRVLDRFAKDDGVPGVDLRERRRVQVSYNYSEKMKKKG
jgi:hypothetical protein